MKDDALQVSFCWFNFKMLIILEACGANEDMYYIVNKTFHLHYPSLTFMGWTTVMIVKWDLQKGNIIHLFMTVED